MENEFYKELTNSLKIVSDVTTRIDERVKVLVEDNNVFKGRFEKMSELQSALISRLSILESDHNVSDLKNDVTTLNDRVEGLSIKLIKLEQDVYNIERNLGQHDNRWTNIIDFLYKIGTIVVGSIILWKLGIKP